MASDAIKTLDSLPKTISLKSKTATRDFQMGCRADYVWKCTAAAFQVVAPRDASCSNLIASCPLMFRGGLIAHDPIIYPVAATVNAKPGTIQYLAFLRSAAARSIFQAYGFSVLVKPTS